MKTASDYLEELDGWLVPADLPESVILEKAQLFSMLNEARKDAIEECYTLVKKHGAERCFPPQIKIMSGSILSLINELQ